VGALVCTVFSVRIRQALVPAVPVLGLVALLLTWGSSPSVLASVALVALHVALVLSAVSHAEAIARRVGEPYGTLVLALAVTVIEVALIVTLMVQGAPGTLARDTVFAAVMIACNGVLGGAFLVNARRTHLVRFSAQGANALLATLLTLVTATMVVPTFDGGPGGTTPRASHLFFAGVAAFVVYGVFVFVQTGRHRWMFLSPDALEEESDDVSAHVSPHPATSRFDLLSVRSLLLVVSLVGVVGLAKTLSSRVEDIVAAVGAPPSFVGVVIAALVLLPESLAAFRSAARNEMQTSINLSLGSAIASIGLTVPAIAVASLWLDGPVVLGLGGAELALLVATAFVTVLSFGAGKATVLQATQHLALFATFCFLAATP
jgi:Ca2+:H+ antiporter